MFIEERTERAKGVEERQAALVKERVTEKEEAESRAKERARGWWATGAESDV